MNKGINVFSGFGGIECGMLALRKVGIVPNIYLLSEINENAIRIAMWNFPNIVQLGDITKIKVKTIYLSEAYDYICKKYFNGNVQSLQSIISEREMLYRINEEQTFSAYWGTQEPNKIGRIQSNTSLSINDRIWFWRNPMGNSEGLYDIIRGGDRREIPNTLNVGKLCEHSFWWNGDRQYESRIEKESIKGDDGTSSERKIETIDSRIIENIFFNNGIERSSTNKSIGATSRSDKEEKLFECDIKIGQSHDGVKETTDRRNQAPENVFEIETELQTANENNGIINNNRNITSFYKKIQITVVECEWGLIIFKGKIQIAFAGSPCQSFSGAGPRNGFDGKSGLFWEQERLWKEIQPEYWLLENVEMKKEWEDVISDTLGVPVIHINSDLVSGQNRPRIYLTNIPYTPIKDKGIMLSDVVLGAKCGTNTHGKLIPEYLRVRNSKGKIVKYKHDGWKDSIRDKGCCLVRSRGHYRNIQGEVIGYTPENAEALQTVPKGYTNVPGVSNTSRHEVLGNGWTVDVLVEAFFKNLPWATKLRVSIVNKVII